MSSIGINTNKTFMRQVASIFIQLCSITIVARGLGVEGNGLYALAILLPTFMAMFLSIGLTSSNIYFVAKKEFSLSTIYTTTISMGVIIVTIGLTCGFLLVKLYRDIIFPNIPFEVLTIALFIFPFSLMNTFQLSFLQAIEDFSTYNIVSLVQPIVFLFMIYSLYIFDLLNLKNTVLSSLISPLFVLVISTFYVVKKGYAFKLSNYSGIYMKRSLSYGLRSHMSNLVAFVNYRADIFLLSLLATPISVGLYHVAVQIVERLWILSQVMNAVLFPQFVALHQEDVKRVELIAKAFKVVIILTLVASLLLSIFGYYAIGLFFGEDFLDAYYAILFLIPGVVFGAGSKILGNAIAAKGKPEINMYTSVFAMVLNIILNIFLIPEYGFIGAAIATSISYTANSILKVWIVNRIENSFYFNYLYLKKDDFYYIYMKIITIINKRSQ